MTNKNEIKKISATYLGDEAIGVDLLEKSMRVNKLFRSKAERDTALVSLGLSALKYCAEVYKKQHSVKYPSYEDILNFLTSEKIEIIPAPAKQTKQK